MLDFDNNALHNRVSRRIFILFLLSAVLPICTISLIAYNQINKQLESEARRQIYRESRALGLNLYDRFLSLETNLNIIANEIDRGASPGNFRDDPWLQTIYNGLALYSDEKLDEVISGNKWNETIVLSESQSGHLVDGKTVLVIESAGTEAQVLYFLRGIGSRAGKTVIAGKINTETIWDLGIHHPDLACFMTTTGAIISCTQPLQPHYRQQLQTRVVNQPDFNYQELNFEGHQYAANIWKLFLKARYNHDDIMVVMAVPARAAFHTYHSFKSIFPQTLVVTGLIIALLSITQIRRSLDPLQKLTAGIKRVANGNYNEPVEIKSNDEFEELGVSFNEMAKKIDEQINTTNFFAEIDRLILSSLDTNYIINTLIRFVHNFIHARYVSVVTIENQGQHNAKASYNIDENFETIVDKSLHIDNKDLVELEFNSDHMYTSDSKSYTNYFDNIRKLHYLVIPIWEKGNLTGILVLSDYMPYDLADSVLIELRELADRVAVALSNAAWEKKLYIQAHYDDLTNLPNRHLFDDRLQQAIERARRQNFRIALLFIDLDRFKSINDSLGHSVGDEVLKKVANVFSGCIRAYDTLVRLSGDEFVIIITDEDRLEEIDYRAERLAGRISSAMSKPIVIEDREVYVTPSIGISIYPDDTREREELLKYADAAMYGAKSSEEDKYQFYHSKHRLYTIDSLELENDLRHARERGQLELLYQPKINTLSGKLVGSEALVRWNHPRRGMLTPDNFITVAEKSGLIVDIGNWILREACRQTRIWKNSCKEDINLAVNISAKQFRSASLVHSLCEILDDTGLDAKSLELEITESMTIENFQESIKVLQELDSMGVQISIDDFGTGYSSLSYLQQLPLRRLKIDRSFTDQLPGDKNSVAIVKSIIALAHSMDLTVIAEGVEKPEQKQFLQEAGCDELQGFIICIPLTAGEFEEQWL